MAVPGNARSTLCPQFWLVLEEAKFVFSMPHRSLGEHAPPANIERSELADTKEERRQLRKISKQREDEARWLQKVLFDLSKARDAREKLVEATKEDLNPLITLDDDTQVPLDKLEEIIQKRVDDLRESLGQGSYNR